MNFFAKGAVLLLAVAGAYTVGKEAMPLMKAYVRPSASGATYVTVDTYKLQNAFFSKTAQVVLNDGRGVSDVATLGTQAERALDTVAQRYGDDTVVIAKAVVLRGDLPDITDEILIELSFDPATIPSGPAQVLDAPATSINESELSKIQGLTLKKAAEDLLQDALNNKLP